MKRKFEEEEEERLYRENHGLSWRRGPLLGRGGFGSVYLAKSRNRVYPPLMAVKSAEVSVSDTLQKEKQVFNYLPDCPHILRCYGEETTTNKDGSMLYNLLLEYASGGTLSALIKKSGGGSGLPEADVKRYARSILKGIDYIHSHGFVHCDLKPDNVMLVCAENRDHQFVAKIGDFGLAKKVGKNDSFIGGTASYMAPETVVESVQQFPSDIWAFGCIVFEMLSGEKVWDSKSDMATDEVFEKIADRYQLPQIPNHISKDAKGFLKGCLVKNPMFRFTTEMLLNHPFVSQLEDGDGREFEEILDEDALSSSDDESSDWSSISEESSFSSSSSSYNVQGSDMCDSVESTKTRMRGSMVLQSLP